MQSKAKAVLELVTEKDAELNKRIWGEEEVKEAAEAALAE